MKTDRCRAETISVGTELLRGEITDTNAGYLAAEMPLLGIELHHMSTVGDDREQLGELLRRAMARSDLIITGGGLGPTEDDLTRESIAAVVGEEPAVDPELEKNLRAMFARMGRDMPAHNIKQALLIPSAVALPNPRGTAPGWWVEKDHKAIVALPGPPRELMPMWRNEVVPRIQARFPGEAILSRTVKTFTVPEARVAELVQPFFESGDLKIGIYAKQDGIHIRLIAQGSNAEQVLDTAEATLQETFSPYVWGRDNDTLEEVVCRCLAGRNLTLATMEDGTGGLVANNITQALHSCCFRGGLVTPSTETKIAQGVDDDTIKQHGLISAEAAEAMAVAARETFDADFGVSTTGIAEVEDPEGKPPGLSFVGVADAHGTRTWQQSFPPSRPDSRERGAVAALFRLRERLIETGLSGSQT